MINSANGFPSIADKTINIDGINIAYKDEGSGQIILCLHALGHSSKDFASLYKLPLERFRIIALDFPGQGLSSPSSVPVSSNFYFGLIKQVYSTVGFEKYHCGWKFYWWRCSNKNCE